MSIDLYASIVIDFVTTGDTHVKKNSQWHLYSRIKMPRPTEVRKETSVGRGRGRTEWKQTRPTRKKKKIVRFDFNKFKRMEYWNESKTKEENKRRNPVKRKKIGGRRKA